MWLNRLLSRRHYEVKHFISSYCDHLCLFVGARGCVPRPRESGPVQLHAGHWMAAVAAGAGCDRVCHGW